ncbi:hypothetical protein [Rugamonas apoptosis]|uniref:Uncharacterized protein n=1 Tax=Rugamonas apoptosis TaxID=2758570 RepID=A0A7W2IKS2_9BURK|nr:hypothetical protein [Rugamonas apoptosis]MBA5687676.1 hypothetical protein [Rugamonas apoptosis]
MTTIIKHHRVNIVVLERGEEIARVCGNGDIAIVNDDAGWWIKFVGEGGQLDCYGTPYPSYQAALGSAKAAAEFGTE